MQTLSSRTLAGIAAVVAALAGAVVWIHFEQERHAQYTRAFYGRLSPREQHVIAREVDKGDLRAAYMLLQQRANDLLGHGHATHVQDPAVLRLEILGLAARLAPSPEDSDKTYAISILTQMLGCKVTQEPVYQALVKSLGHPVDAYTSESIARSCEFEAWVEADSKDREHCKLPTATGADSESSRPNLEGRVAGYLSGSGIPVAMPGYSFDWRVDIDASTQLALPTGEAFTTDDFYVGQRVWVWFRDCKPAGDTVPVAAFIRLYSKDPQVQPPRGSLVPLSPGSRPTSTTWGRQKETLRARKRGGS